jgi:uncharacterized protein YneF (UPF0154 family)
MTNSRNLARTASTRRPASRPWRKLERYMLIGAGLIVGFFLGLWIREEPAKAVQKLIIPEVYFQCRSEQLPIPACEAFGRGELPSAEYMRTNLHYDACLSHGGSISQCDAAMRMIYRDMGQSLSERARERNRKQEECVAAANTRHTNPFDCYDPDKFGDLFVSPPSPVVQ